MSFTGGNSRFTNGDAMATSSDSIAVPAKVWNSWETAWMGNGCVPCTVQEGGCAGVRGMCVAEKWHNKCLDAANGVQATGGLAVALLVVVDQRQNVSVGTCFGDAGWQCRGDGNG